MDTWGDRSAVILDRHPLWLDALQRLLEERTGLDVAGRATSGSVALALVEEHRPDLFVAGLEFRDGEGHGLACLRRVRAACPEVRSVVVTADDDPETIDAAFAEGAVAYCLKTAEPDDLVAAIRQSFEHSIYIGGGRRVTASAAGEPVLRSVERKPVTELTRRELEILQLVAEGHSNLQLAQMLWVTEQTVKFHLSNIYRKLQVSNRTEASRWAQLNGLLTSATPRPAAVPSTAA